MTTGFDSIKKDGATSSLEGYLNPNNEIFRMLDLSTRRSDIPVELRLIIKQYLYMTIDSNEELKRYVDNLLNKRDKNARTVAGPIKYLDTSRVNDMSNLFKGVCMIHVNLSQWDVSNVTNMSSMFESTSGVIVGQMDIRIPVSLQRWNVSKVVSMKAMFKNARYSVLNLGEWDTRSLEDAEDMFYGAAIPESSLENWNTSRLRNAKGMFKKRGGMKWNWAIEKWDMQNVENMACMFEQCERFNRPIGCWNISKVKNLRRMLEGATIFNQDLNNWDTSSVSTMESMFMNAYAFNQPLNRWNVQNVHNFHSMFLGAATFNQPLNDWKVKKAFTASHMFSKCVSLNQDFSEWFQEDNNMHPSAGGMFHCCPLMKASTVRTWVWVRRRGVRIQAANLGFLNVEDVEEYQEEEDAEDEYAD